MKIEIDYNGAFAVCRIEPMERVGEMVNFNDADAMSQTYALSAFRTIKEHWQREKRLSRYKNLPVMNIRCEFQVSTRSIEQILELSKQGVIIEWSFDVSRDTKFCVKLNDNHTIVEDNGWLLQDTEGRWWGMDNDYHRMLQEYQKINIQKA